MQVVSHFFEIKHNSSMLGLVWPRELIGTLKDSSLCLAFFTVLVSVYVRCYEITNNLY